MRADSGRVDLPQYVHKVTKRRKAGKPLDYYFYTRHRNTERAWPSIALPEPMSKEFSSAYAICSNLERDEGRWLLFGQELPHHSDKAFWPKAAEITRAKERRDHDDAKDFAALIDQFEDSPAFTGLAKATQRGYRTYGKMVREAWAYDRPRDMTAVDAQEAIDALSDTPAVANQFRAYGSRLVAWGIPRGFSDHNPFADTEKAPKGEPWKPWPEWAFDILFEHAPFNLLMPCVSALFTGQRQSDVLPMERPKPSDAQIEVTAQKTGSTVWIDIHSEYRPWITMASQLYAAANDERMANKKPAILSNALHLGVRGLPYQTTDGFRSEFQALMRSEPFKRFREERIVFHGLRKNAVNMLLEVGCTENQVGAIVNMSEQMVRHYSRDVNVRRLARDGMKKLEERASEVLPKAISREREQNANWKPARRVGNRWERSTREK